MQRLGHERQVIGVEDEAGAAERLGHRACVPRDDRDPCARASTSGAQKPSCADIERYTSARRYQASRASAEIGPVKTTRSTPISATRRSSARRYGSKPLSEPTITRLAAGPGGAGRARTH